MDIKKKSKPLKALLSQCGSNLSRCQCYCLTQKVFSLFLPLCIYIFFPTCRYISVNLAVELISHSGLRHVILTEEGERTWHPLQTNLQNLRSDKTIYTLSHHLSFTSRRHSRCVLNRFACSDQFCLLDVCWVYGMLQMVQDNLMGCHMSYLLDRQVINRHKHLSFI